ncbi:ArsR/SmtB family transcription factor [Raineyella antarctica]|uniref:ArsR/SmtB family transcription factor n=1 Tax=Raineyella antarctica TaxID=1577474 RepID=UPI000B89A3AE|nr:metalloregulator ArsR/SmtB family transcription factor [Raineyella antarctica]
MTILSGASGGSDVESGGAGSEDLVSAAALFHGLSDPTRLAILQHLTSGEHRVRDLVEHLGLAQSTVSAHLACLRECGLVESRPQGRASLFSLANTPALLALLVTAERLLAATGYAVTLCPNYGIGTTGNPAPEDLKFHDAKETDR